MSRHKNHRKQTAPVEPEAIATGPSKMQRAMNLLAFALAVFIVIVLAAVLVQALSKPKSATAHGIPAQTQVTAGHWDTPKK